MKNRFGTTQAGSRRVSLRSALTAGASAVALMAGLALVPSVAASAVTLGAHAASAPVCTAKVTAGSGQVVNGDIIAGVTAGSTQITLDCNASTQAALAVEASLLSSISSSNVVATSEVDTSAIGDFAPSATDTGCPAGVAGQCETAGLAIPASYTAADPNAACPPTQAQINAGIFGCAIAAVTAADTEIAGSVFLVQYASQTTAPSAPSISALQTTGSVGSNINVADASGATSYWWGDANQVIQSDLLGVLAQAPPSSCTTGGGYGDVPSSTLNVLWYSSGSMTPIEDSAANVTISNNCYTGTTLDTPVLGGTIPVPPTATAGTYEVFVCELNLTPYQGGGPAQCGPNYNGLGWIGASFVFTVAPGIISQNLPVGTTLTSSATAGYTTQLVTSGYSGAVTYSQTTGSPDLAVSSSGAVTTSGKLAPGSYTASGTTKDGSGNSGTFSYTLTVTGAPAVPKATSCSGAAVPGASSTLTIHGKNFTASPHVTSAGAAVSVVHANATSITVKVKESKSAKKGSHVFSIRFASGKSTSVKFTVK
jgi:hypothetical protein